MTSLHSMLGGNPIDTSSDMPVACLLSESEIHFTLPSILQPRASHTHNSLPLPEMSAAVLC